jgi:hypothetical protein
VFNAAVAALRSGEEEWALQTLAPARAADPGDARLWQITGLLHRQIDELEPAIGALSEAARLNRGDARIAHALARAHLEAGLPAVALFRAAQRLAPQDGELVLGLAAALEEEEGPAAALAELEYVLSAWPTWIPGIETITRLRWQCGEAGNLAAFDRALAREPRNMDLWRAFIVTLTQADLYEPALAAVARGREAAGENLLFDANEAVARAELGQSEAAEALFARLSGLDDATVKVRYVRHLLRTGRVAEAASEAEAATRGPQPHFFWPYVATAWRLTGDPRWEWLEGDPRLVGIYDLSDSLPPLDALAERLRALHRTSHQPLEQSVRGGTQTQGPLLSRLEPEIRALRTAIVAAVETHIAQLPPADRNHPTLSVPRTSRVRFSGAWSVRLTGGGHHANHIHPMGWFSSALYVVLPGASAGGNAPAGWLTLGEPQKELGVDLPPFRTIEPKPGRLVLFPSTMWHGTVPFAAGERMTVAFDVAKP